MTTDDTNAPAQWKKTEEGYVITEPKWGANITFHTKESKTEAELDFLLRFFYANNPSPLRKGGNYAWFVPS